MKNIIELTDDLRFISKKLDTSEADHIASILKEYKANIHYNILKSIALGKLEEVAWFEGHLKWHETVMAKIKWGCQNET